MNSKDKTEAKKSLTIKEWAKEVEFALEEARSIYEESSPSLDEVDFYKMAPLIAAIFNDIENEKTKNEMRAVSWSNVQYVHSEIPSYKVKSKRCFAHAYLDSVIFLRLITVKKSEKVLDYLGHKKVIENESL